MKTLEKYVKFKNGKKRDVDEGEYPVYGGNGVLAFSKNYNAERCVIIGRVGAYCGTVYLSEERCWISDNAIVARPKTNADLKFIYYLLKSLQLNMRSIGTSQPLLTQEILNRIEVDIPDVTVQKRVSTILADIDEKICINKKINDNLAA